MARNQAQAQTQLKVAFILNQDVSQSGIVNCFKLTKSWQIFHTHERNDLKVELALSLSLMQALGMTKIQA